jgi:uncharacterized protein
LPIPPIADADTIATGARVSYYQDWIAHETYDDYWAQMDYRSCAANLPPTVHLGGAWVDFFLPDVLENYARLNTTDRTVRLLVGSGAHGRNMATRAYQRDTFALLDSAFGHIGAAGRHEPAGVRLRITGRPHWREEPTWPPANQPTPWYAQPAGVLATDPAPQCEPSRYQYDPADPTPTTGGTAVGLRAGARDNRAIERRTDVLTFTSTPLTSDLTVIGPVHATVYIRSSVIYTDVFVRLCDVHPRGKSINVCDGLTRLHANNFPFHQTATEFARHGSTCGRLVMSYGRTPDSDSDLQRRPSTLQPQPGQRSATGHRNQTRDRKPINFPRPAPPHRD